MKIKTFDGVVSDSKAVRSYRSHFRLFKKYLHGRSSSAENKRSYHALCCGDIGRSNRLWTKDEKLANAKIAGLSLKGGK
jgi:hypothetical protein